jgi:hypothetical protein
VADVKGVLASGNAHKLEELAAAMPHWQLELLGPREFPPEDGETYADNARGKAVFGRRFTPEDAWAIGEDSGLEVEGLDGRPGVHSARFAAGRPVERLLEALAGIGGDGRRARRLSWSPSTQPAGSCAAPVRPGPHRDRAARSRASATTRSSSPTARSACPSSGTPGRPTRTVPAAAARRRRL